MSESDSVHSDWSDWEEDTEEAPVQCLFSVARFATVEEALEHDKQTHGFDFISFLKQRRMDFHETIQLINYVRKHSQADDIVERLQTIPIQEPGPWESESYLVPVLDDDALLSHDWEEGDGDELDDVDEEEQRRRLQKILGQKDPAAMDDLQEVLASMLDEREIERKEKNDGTSQATTTKQCESKEVDQAYFDSYSSFDIHQQMLADKPRTEAYRRALEQNPTLLSGKTVVDVGCGTGILSMFAARGGASRVIGVEASSAMAAVARSNIEANGLSDRVSIICTKAENLQLKDDCQADIIVSEWMGYALLFETMLDSVLHVRDKFLKPGGAVLPDLLSIKVAGASAKAAGLDFWDDVYGFAMPEIGKKVRQAAQREALVRIVPPDSLITEPITARTLDIVTMAPEDQDFRMELSLPKKDVPLQNTDSQLACVVLWFDAEFSRRFCDQMPVLLDTSPLAPATHWAQTVLTLKTPVDLGAPGVKGLHVALGMTRSSDTHRQLDISLQTVVWHENETQSPADLLASSEAQTQLFTMSVKQ